MYNLPDGVSPGMIPGYYDEKEIVTGKAYDKFDELTIDSQMDIINEIFDYEKLIELALDAIEKNAELEEKFIDEVLG